MEKQNRRKFITTLTIMSAGLTATANAFKEPETKSSGHTSCFLLVEKSSIKRRSEQTA